MYARWEQSLEQLRSKRCKRLNIRHLNYGYAGQARVFSIYERAVNRHPGNAQLWRDYLTYVGHVKATRRWRKVMVSALRMNPTDPDLWILAGQRSARNGDMAAARNFFMRGCRFCSKDYRIWVEYARCELQWLEKMIKRQTNSKKKRRSSSSQLAKDSSLQEDSSFLALDDVDGSDDEDENTLPEPSESQANVIDQQAVEQLESSPAMDGAIPIAIFDISRKQPFFNPAVAEAFFLMFASFHRLAVQPKLSKHVLDFLDENYPQHPTTCSCYIRQPIAGLDHRTPEFPRNLRHVLLRLTERLETTTDKMGLRQATAAWISGYLALDDLDEAIRAVLENTKERLV